MQKERLAKEQAEVQERARVLFSMIFALLCSHFAQCSQIEYEDALLAEEHQLLMRRATLQAQGLWMDRLPEPQQEPERKQTQWDYMLAEMVCSFPFSSLLLLYLTNHVAMARH